MNDTGPSTESPSTRRQALELEKLEHEVEKLRLSWWKQADYVRSLVPIAIALFGFLVAYLGGVFNTQRLRLQQETASLKDSVTVYSDKLSTISVTLQLANDSLATLRASVCSLEQRESALHDTIANQINMIAALNENFAIKIKALEKQLEENEQKLRHLRAFIAILEEPLFAELNIADGTVEIVGANFGDAVGHLTFILKGFLYPPRMPRSEFPFPGLQLDGEMGLKPIEIGVSRESIRKWSNEIIAVNLIEKDRLAIGQAIDLLYRNALRLGEGSLDTWYNLRLETAESRIGVWHGHNVQDLR